MFAVTAQRIHASSDTYLALMKDNAYDLQLRGEIEVKVRIHLRIRALKDPRFHDLGHMIKSPALPSL